MACQLYHVFPTISSHRPNGHHQPCVNVPWGLASSLCWGKRNSYFVYFSVLRIEPGLLPTLGKSSTRELQSLPWFFSPYRSGHAHNLPWGNNFHFSAACLSVSRCFSLTPWTALCSSSCKCFAWFPGYFLLDTTIPHIFFQSISCSFCGW